MGETKTTQKEAKKDLDRKLSLSSPAALLEELAIAQQGFVAECDLSIRLFSANRPSFRALRRSILDGLVKEGYIKSTVYGAATVSISGRLPRIQSMYLARSQSLIPSKELAFVFPLVRPLNPFCRRPHAHMILKSIHSIDFHTILTLYCPFRTHF
jgi:hypothetical protein